MSHAMPFPFVAFTHLYSQPNDSGPAKSSSSFSALSSVPTAKYDPRQYPPIPPHIMFAIERFVVTEEGGGGTPQQRDVDKQEEKQDKLAQYLARVQQRRGDKEKESKIKRKRDSSAAGQEESQEVEDEAPMPMKKDKEKTGKRKKERLADAEEGKMEEEHADEASEGKQAKVRMCGG